MLYHLCLRVLGFEKDILCVAWPWLWFYSPLYFSALLLLLLLLLPLY